MITRLILIRHGSTYGNSSGRYCGLTDVSLNDEGKKQAQRLRDRLKDKEIHQIYSSDKKRAIETCAILFGTREVERIADLREVSFGAFEGLTHNELMERHPALYQRWLDDPFKVSIPDGEDLPEFEKRVMEQFNKIVSVNENKTAVVVCHGGTISIFINNILKLRDFWKFLVKPASMTIVEYKDGKYYLNPRWGEER